MKKPIVGTIRHRLTAEIFYLKLHSLLFMLNILPKISQPSKEQAEKVLMVLSELKEKLEVD